MTPCVCREEMRARSVGVVCRMTEHESGIRTNSAAVWPVWPFDTCQGREYNAPIVHPRFSGFWYAQALTRFEDRTPRSRLVFAPRVSLHRPQVKQHRHSLGG